MKNFRRKLEASNKSSLAIMWFSRYGLQGGDWRRPDLKRQTKTLHGRASHSLTSMLWGPLSPSKQKSPTPNWHCPSLELFCPVTRENPWGEMLPSPSHFLRYCLLWDSATQPWPNLSDVLEILSERAYLLTSKANWENSNIFLEDFYFPDVQT